MAILVNRKDIRSELQKRVAAELSEKLKSTQSLTYEKPTNSIEENTHEARNLGTMFVVVAIVIFFGIAIFLLSR